MSTGTCPSCGRTVYYLANNVTGRRAMVDPDPDPKGNCVILPGEDRAPAQYYVRVPPGQDDLFGEWNHLPRHMNHLATCPNQEGLHSDRKARRSIHE